MPHEHPMHANLLTKMVEPVVSPAHPPEDFVQTGSDSGWRLHRRLNYAASYTALAALFGAFLIIAGGVGTALAADDDDEPLDKRLFGKFMHALGLTNGTEPGVNAQERPPLVVPPNRDLPPPEAPGSLTARNPAWPVDPDEAQRKVEKKAKVERKAKDWYEYGEALKPDELATGKVRQSTPPTATAATQQNLPGNQMSPSELGFANNMFKDMFGLGKVFSDEPEVANFVREPPRASLTDPPRGYRTPSPAEPYGTRFKRDVKKKEVGDRQSDDGIR